MLNARDVAALNRAREVLKRLEDVALNRALGEHDPFAPVAGWDLGRLSEAATAADDAILHVLRTRAEHQPRDLRAAGGSTGRYF